MLNPLRSCPHTVGNILHHFFIEGMFQTDHASFGIQQPKLTRVTFSSIKPIFVDVYLPLFTLNDLSKKAYNLCAYCAVLTTLYLKPNTSLYKDRLIKVAPQLDIAFWST